MKHFYLFKDPDPSHWFWNHDLIVRLYVFPNFQIRFKVCNQILFQNSDDVKYKLLISINF